MGGGGDGHREIQTPTNTGIMIPERGRRNKNGGSEGNGRTESQALARDLMSIHIFFYSTPQRPFFLYLLLHTPTTPLTPATPLSHHPFYSPPPLFYNTPPSPPHFIPHSTPLTRPPPLSHTAPQSPLPPPSPL